MGTPRLRFGTGTTVKDFRAYERWLSTAEAAGFALLTTGDSQSLWADPFVIMTVAALRTTTPRLAVTVSNPRTRHPAVAASASVAIQQLSGRRFCLGIASGDSALRNIGVAPAPVAEIEAYVTAVQRLTRGEPAAWRGAEATLRWAAEPVPVWMAAEGPRTLRLAGRIADGVVLSNSLTPDAFRRNMAYLAEGVREAGRPVESIEVWCMANVVPAPTEQEGIDAIRYLLAGTANHVYRFTLEGKGLPDERRAPIEELMRRYDSRHHATPETAEANARLVDELGLTHWLAGHSTIAGPVEACVERLHEIAATGIRNLIVAQFVPDPLAFMRTFAERVMPAFA